MYSDCCVLFLCVYTMVLSFIPFLTSYIISHISFIMLIHDVAFDWLCLSLSQPLRIDTSNAEMVEIRGMRRFPR